MQASFLEASRRTGGRIATMLLLVTSACGTDLLGPHFGESLDHFGGCADVTFFAVDDGDEIMVTFRADGLVTEALAAGVETSTVFDFPSAEAELVVEQGSRVSDATCDDVIENDGPDVDRTWVAVSGQATVRIRPVAAFDSGRGDLLLEDVVFATDEGDQVTLERLEWLDVSVGWFPG